MHHFTFNLMAVIIPVTSLIHDHNSSFKRAELELNILLTLSNKFFFSHKKRQKLRKPGH